MSLPRTVVVPCDCIFFCVFLIFIIFLFSLLLLSFNQITQLRRLFHTLLTVLRNIYHFSFQYHRNVSFSVWWCYFMLLKWFGVWLQIKNIFLIQKLSTRPLLEHYTKTNQNIGNLCTSQTNHHGNRIHSESFCTITWLALQSKMILLVFYCSSVFYLRFLLYYYCYYLMYH